jgi:hypothetical protein
VPILVEELVEDGCDRESGGPSKVRVNRARTPHSHREIDVGGNHATIPPLRDPTRQKAARKRKIGPLRSG